MKAVYVTAEPVPYGTGFGCEMESPWHQHRSMKAVAYAVIALAHGRQARFPVCLSCWADLADIAEGRNPNHERPAPDQVPHDEVVRRLGVYDELCRFAANYEWAEADGGKVVMEMVAEILAKGKEADQSG